MPSWAQSGIPLVVFLFFVVFFRAQGTYWIARSVPTAISKWGTNSKRFAGLAKWVDGPVPRKGANILEHWGIVAIPPVLPHCRNADGCTRGFGSGADELGQVHGRDDPGMRGLGPPLRIRVACRVDRGCEGRCREPVGLGCTSGTCWHRPRPQAARTHSHGSNGARF